VAEDPKDEKTVVFAGKTERVGYEPVAHHRDETQLRRRRTEARGESAVGSLIASAGVIWAVYVGTHNFTSLQDISLPRGPIELAGAGILIWLHAKWRAR
jgi:hypothetical protein